ncbi:cora-like Mg2+ transporter protein-domain-containing protein, partial [Jimgerdemannia flammicorona]
VRKRIRQLKDFITVTPDWINYALIDDITDSFAPLIQQIELEVDSIDDLVLLLRESEQSDMLRRIGHCRKKVMQLLRLLSTKADVVKGLMKRFEVANEMGLEAGAGVGGSSAPINAHKRAMHHNVALYLGDIQDHIVTMVQNLNHYETILARSHSNYLAQISIELTQTSSVTNDVVGRLTVFATVIVPMNLVTGLFGMNVKVPGRDQDDLVWFFWILGVFAMFAVVGFAIAKRSALV